MFFFSAIKEKDIKTVQWNVSNRILKESLLITSVCEFFLSAEYCLRIISSNNFVCPSNTISIHCFLQNLVFSIPIVINSHVLFCFSYKCYYSSLTWHISRKPCYVITNSQLGAGNLKYLIPSFRKLSLLFDYGVVGYVRWFFVLWCGFFSGAKSLRFRSGKL